MFVAVSMLYIFMSVNIAERPTEKKTVHFDRGVFAKRNLSSFFSKAEF